jgi:hypothetical protein
LIKVVKHRAGHSYTQVVGWFQGYANIILDDYPFQAGGGLMTQESPYTNRNELPEGYRQIGKN